MEKLSYQEQTIITRGIIKSAVLMSEYGAESILIEQTAQRLGRALGVDSVEISMIPSAIVLTTLNNGQSVTTTRRVHHKPINMSIVCQIQKIVLNMEKNEHDINYLYTILKN
ncbi:threonine/serine exporter family protein, partial [Aliarcobacter butzleri]